MTKPEREIAPVMSERRVSLIGALLVAIGPISLALYSPAMTMVGEALHTTDAMVNLTMTLYFGGFAVAQLIAGPVSDALGRRPVTFAFMSIYLAASLLALVAPSIEMLIVARFLQGVGASAGVAISRAVVRDLYKGDQSSRIMNLIGIILAIGPAMAPTIGGVMLEFLSWRAVFALMVVMGLAVVGVTAFGLKETVVADRSRFRVRVLLASYGELLTNRHFLSTTIVLAGAIGAMYAQLTFLPFILMGEVGLSPTEFGIGMLLQTGCFFVGSLLVRVLIRRISAYRLLLPGLVFIAIGCIGILMLFQWPVTYLHVMGPVGVYAFGIAFVMPAITTAALAPFPHIAGAAASMMGFLQMGAGLLMGSLGGLFADPVIAMATLIPIMGATACIAYVVYRLDPQSGEVEPRADVITTLPVGRTQMPD